MAPTSHAAASAHDDSPESSPTLGSVARNHRWALVASAVLATIAAACSLAPYLAVYAVTVELFGTDGPPRDERIMLIAALTAAAIVVRAIASGASSHVAHVAAYRILAELRLLIAARFRSLPLGTVQAMSAGEVKKLMHDDVEQLEEAFAHGIPDAAAATAVPLSTTVVLFAIDWRLGLAALAALLGLVAISIFGMRAAQKNSGPLMAHAMVTNTAVMSYLDGIKVIRGYLRPDSGLDQARNAITEGARLYDRSTQGTTRHIVAAMAVGTGVGIAILLPLAGTGFVNGWVDLPTLALFLLLGLGYLTPVISLVQVLATILSRIQFAGRSVADFLSAPVLPEPSHPSSPERYDIVFEDVSFGYTPDALVMHEVNVSIPQGSHIALVGPTGAGKSTIARLIARFWDVTEGSVTIGGVDVRHIGASELSRLVAFVQQDEYIFGTSLLENIRVAHPQASDAQVLAAAKQAQLSELIDQLPEGIHTELTPGGSTLSGGQRQRVSIARAIVKDSPILILDEATASLDAQTEHETLLALESVTAGRTVVAIAHRLSTIRNSDVIAVIDDGRIAATGQHDDLLINNRQYAALWESYTSAAGWRLKASETDTTIAGARTESIRTTVGSVDAEATDIITADLASRGFARQWRALLGRGWPRLLRQGLPRMVIEGTVRSVPLVAVFAVLNAAIGHVSEGKEITNGFIWVVTGLLLIGLMARFVLSEWTNGAIWSIANHAKADIQLSLIERLRRVPLGFFSTTDTAKTTTLITTDVVFLDFQNVPQQVTGAILQPLYAAVILSVIDWRLALAALAGIPVFLFINQWADHIFRRVVARVHEVRARTSVILIEQAKGAAILRGANQDSFMLRRFTAAVDDLREASIMMSVRATPATSVGAASIELGTVALIVVGAGLFTAGSVSATTLLLFLMLTLVMYQPIQELNTLAGYRHNQQQIAAKIAEVWDTAPLPEPEVPAATSDSSVEFRHVGFSYDTAANDAESAPRDSAKSAPRDSAESALTDVSFTARPGTVTALVGPSGAGKSTVAHLTSRLWDVSDGSILIGGADLRDLGSDAVMNLVTTVHQDVYLFATSIRDNVTLGAPDATDDEIWRALKAAQIDDFVGTLPDGLETQVNEAGVSLSGGQRQRLSIARALLKNSPILILDEAVASVDPETEAQIQAAISELAQGRTVIVIAHRMSTVEHADQIVVLNDGAVDGAGTHDELLATSSTYRQLVE